MDIKDFLPRLRRMIQGPLQTLMVDSLMTSTVSFCKESQVLREVIDALDVTTGDKVQISSSDVTLMPWVVVKVYNDDGELKRDVHYHQDKREEITFITDVKDVKILASFYPSDKAQVPDIIKEYEGTCCHGAAAEMYVMPGREWSDGGLYSMNNRSFVDGTRKAWREIDSFQFGTFQNPVIKTSVWYQIMAADTIEYLINQVNDQLVDDGFTRWPKDKLLDYFNDAQRTVCLIRPDAFIKEDSFACVAGTKQTLPDDGSRLVDVRMNAAGYAVVNRQRREITELYPTWYGTTGEDQPEAFIYDEREPKTFFLFPGVSVGLVVEIIYSAAPPIHEISSLDPADKADLDNMYSTAITEFMMYKAHSKDFEHSEQAKAAQHYQMFAAILGNKTESDSDMTPTNKD